MAGFFFSLFFFLIPYALCFFALMCDGGYVYMRDLWHSLSLLRMLLTGLILLMITTVVVYWVQQDRFIYYWDYSGYWIKSVDRMKYMLWHSFGEILSTLVKSVNEDTYNLFLPTMTAFPLAAFGYTFPTYVLLYFLLFQVPSAFIMALSAVKGIKGLQQEKAVFLLLPSLWRCSSRSATMLLSEAILMPAFCFLPPRPYICWLTMIFQEFLSSEMFFWLFCLCLPGFPGAM